MKMIKTLVAATLLAASFSANAKIIYKDVNNSFDAGSAKLTFNKSDDKTAFSLESQSKTLDAGYFTTESFVNISSKLANQLTGLKAWYEVAGHKYELAFKQQNDKLWVGSFAKDAQFVAGDYKLHITGNLLQSTGNINYSTVTAPVPEPETYALMGMGLVGLLAARRRKAKQA